MQSVNLEAIAETQRQREGKESTRETERGYPAALKLNEVLLYRSRDQETERHILVSWHLLKSELLGAPTSKVKILELSRGRFGERFQALSLCVHSQIYSSPTQT